MPVHELEQHPYLNYYTQFRSNIESDYYKGIIVGSFPIYAVTDSINMDLEITIKRFTVDGTMRFFYGSRKSDLWKYVGLALVNIDPRKNGIGAFEKPDIAVENCKQLLFQNKLLISDSLYRTNRTDQSADDSGLMVSSEIDYVNQLKTVNYALKNQLQENIGIESIYFTSTSMGAKSPYGWFLKIFDGTISISNQFKVGVRTWSAIAKIDFGDGDVRQYNIFFLPTPKPRGIHWKLKRTIMFENFLRTIHPHFYYEVDPIPAGLLNSNQESQLSDLRVAFLTECYRQAIVFKKLNFDGSNGML